MSGDRWVQRYTQWVIRWRWPIVLATLLVVVVAGSGMQHLAFATNYRVFFGKNNPELANFEAVQNIYTKNDSIVFTVTPDDGEVFTHETLAAIERLTEEAWQIPNSIRVDSITNFQHSWAEGDDLIVEDLIAGAADSSAAEIDRARAIALSRPELLNRLISSSGAVAGVNVTLQLAGEDPAELNAPVAKAREIVAVIEQAYPHVDVRTSGL
ncbi:MAG: hypothetical protein O7A98_02900, partial [Acidobacteria bacterium]|nr:hypothetical protein [Acidobacteriota bacterium]